MVASDKATETVDGSQVSLRTLLFSGPFAGTRGELSADTCRTPRALGEVREIVVNRETGVRNRWQEKSFLFGKKLKRLQVRDYYMPVGLVGVVLYLLRGSSNRQDPWGTTVFIFSARKE